MSLLKCACGCDKLSKDELKILLDSTDRVRDFLNNDKAVEMFRAICQEQRIPPLALKYLNQIRTAKEFMENPSKPAEQDGSAGQFSGHVYKGEELLACQDDDSRKAILEEIIRECSIKLETSPQYKKLRDKLIKAYRGKEQIQRTD